MGYCEQDLASLLENMQAPFSEAQVRLQGRYSGCALLVVVAVPRWRRGQRVWGNGFHPKWLSQLLDELGPNGREVYAPV